MMSEARLSDQAFVLTVVTLILLTPPIVTIFDVQVFFFGIPLLHVYCFAIWLLAIVVGGYLATRMGRVRNGFVPGDDRDPESDR